ncbi:DUF308 domain-containing protein, partial [Faecalibaculum rodentium]
MKKIQIIEFSAAVLFLVCGTSLLIWPRLSGQLLYWIMTALLAVTVVVLLIRRFTSGSRINYILAAAAAALLVLVASMPGVLASVAFGIYMLFCAVSYFLQAYADGLSNWKNPSNLLFGFGYLVLALILFLARHDDSRLLQIVIG